MKKRFVKNKGYSNELAAEYVDIDSEFLVVSSVEKVAKYDEENKEYTDEYSHSNVYLAQEESPQPFKVKVIDEKLKLKFGSKVRLKNLEACEVNKNIYFKVDSIEVI